MESPHSRSLNKTNWKEELENDKYFEFVPYTFEEQGPAHKYFLKGHMRGPAKNERQLETTIDIK